MDPKIWGPHLWFILHTLAYNYPENPETWRRQSMCAFMYQLGNVLPCKFCREHYKEHIKNYPPEYHLSDGTSFFNYVVFLHNVVNHHSSNGKDVPWPLNYHSKDIRKSYGLIYNKEPFPSIWYGIHLMVLLSISTWIIFSQYKR